MNTCSPFTLRSLLLTLLLATGSGAAWAQLPAYFAPGGGDRAGRWESYVVLGAGVPQGASYPDIAGSDLTADVSIDTYFRGGVGVGYNLNQFWNVNFELLLGAPDFHASVPGEVRSVSDTVFLANGKLNLDWNILPGNFTPLLSAGIGFVTLTVDNPSGGYVCYPDYWWGYVCYEDTRTEAAFTWNVGAGFRVDFGHNIFLKAVGGVEWWLLSQADGVPYQFFGTLAVGMSFR